MRRIILVVAGLALASAGSHESVDATGMTKCHKGTVTVAGGLCDGTKVDIQMCGSPDMTDAMKEEGLTQMGKGAGETLTMDMCTMMKNGMDATCKGVGGTAKDICADPGDFCKMQTESMGGGCSSDDDCKAGSGTGAGDGTGGGTGGTTKKQCCSVIEKTLDTMCKDTTSVATTALVSINCLVLCCDAGPRPPLRPAACGGARALATESCLLPFLRS